MVALGEAWLDLADEMAADKVIDDCAAYVTQQHADTVAFLEFFEVLKAASKVGAK